VFELRQQSIFHLLVFVDVSVLFDHYNWVWLDGVNRINIFSELFFNGHFFCLVLLY
jgi:hypothetical protein